MDLHGIVSKLDLLGFSLAKKGQRGTPLLQVSTAGTEVVSSMEKAVASLAIFPLVFQLVQVVH